MAILLSDEEMDALEGLPHMHRCLYIFGIRRHMDYQTGITGVKRKISYKSLSEEIYVVPQRGFMETGTRSREALRRAVKILEKAGLITIKSNAKNLILQCNLAKSDKSVQNKPDTRPTPQPDTQADINQNNKNNVKNSSEARSAEDKAAPQADIPKNAKADTHPVSGIYKPYTTSETPVDKSKSNLQPYYDLLAERKFHLHLQKDPDTITMLKEWLKNRVTKEEANVGMEHAEAKLGRIPDKPIYYKNFVLDAHRKFELAKQQPTQEIKPNERPNRASKPRYETDVDRYQREMAELQSQNTNPDGLGKH